TLPVACTEKSILNNRMPDANRAAPMIPTNQLNRRLAFEICVSSAWVVLSGAFMAAPRAMHGLRQKLIWIYCPFVLAHYTLTVPSKTKKQNLHYFELPLLSGEDNEPGHQNF